jgi:hypothetical protein
MWSPHVILFLPLPSTNSANTVTGRGWDAAKRAICRWGAPVGAGVAPFPRAPVGSSADAGDGRRRSRCAARDGCCRLVSGTAHPRPWWRRLAASGPPEVEAGLPGRSGGAEVCTCVGEEEAPCWLTRERRGRPHRWEIGVTTSGARACDGASAKERDARRWVGEK